MELKTPYFFIIGYMQGGDKMACSVACCSNKLNRPCCKYDVKGEDSGKPYIMCNKITECFYTGPGINKKDVRENYGYLTKKKGQKWNLAKFHEQLHIIDDIIQNGAPVGSHSGHAEYIVL